MAKIDIERASDSTHRGVLVESKSSYQEPDDVLRLYVSAITGLDKTKVRRRWMPKVGTQPKLDESWCAVGILRVETQGFPYQKTYKADSAEGDVITRQSFQVLHGVASFYGSDAFSLSDLFREGAQVEQNMSVLKRYGLTLISLGEEVVYTPEEYNGQWISRCDVPFKVGRSVERTFGVRTITSADFDFNSDERGTVE